jgi:hypothetical protein
MFCTALDGSQVLSHSSLILIAYGHLMVNCRVYGMHLKCDGYFWQNSSEVNVADTAVNLPHEPAAHANQTKEPDSFDNGTRQPDAEPGAVQGPTQFTESDVGCTRPTRQRCKPVRFRTLQPCELVDSEVEVVMDAKRKHRPRTEEQKLRRANLERGPWHCSLCNHKTFTSLTGFRGHVILAHNQNCSWTGRISEFKSDDEKQKVISAVKKSRSHRKRSSASATSRQPVVSEPNEFSGAHVDQVPDLKSNEGSVEPVSSFLNCRQLRLDINTSLENANHGVRSFSDRSLEEFVGDSFLATLLEAPPIVSTTEIGVQALCVGRRSAGVQMPLAGVMYMPAGITFQKLAEIYFRQPEISVRELALQVSCSRDSPLPQEQLNVLEAVLSGMDAGVKHH